MNRCVGVLNFAAPGMRNSYPTKELCKIIANQHTPTSLSAPKKRIFTTFQLQAIFRSVALCYKEKERANSENGKSFILPCMKLNQPQRWVSMGNIFYNWTAHSKSYKLEQWTSSFWCLLAGKGNSPAECMGEQTNHQKQNHVNIRQVTAPPSKHSAIGTCCNSHKTTVPSQD